ncbi:TPM domain-containing protein [Burkholderiaceae bacterium FT117]|uniref:TPM domain-containing protein n=1 Tax=Zeimonas sediminis TaxID=2944268 RepID=UPI00234314EC|nr:TPM domain-containing protein [Zeimonas sediminis]MCM5570201.1 TPM domain-containing protein [Zeimonas sediminis]
MRTGLSRVWAHLACDSRAVRRLFPDDALRRIEQAVADGERGHAAEIRIAIEASLPWHRVARGTLPRERALEVFSELRVWDTEANNGLLLYLLVADHAIEIVADRSAAAALGPAAMRQVCERLGEALRAGGPEQGLLDAIGALNGMLAEAFPLLSPEADSNELPNRPAIL